MRNYGIPPIEGTSELLEIETRSLPHGAARLCQLSGQPPAWFSFLLKNVDNYQDLQINNPVQGSWISQNKSVVASNLETGTSPENTLVKAILSTPDRNIHQFKNNQLWRILFGSYINGTGDPNGTIVPDFTGQRYIDFLTGNIYISNGETNIDWYLAGTGGGSI